MDQPVHLLWDPLKTNRFVVGSRGVVRLYSWESKVSFPRSSPFSFPHLSERARSDGRFDFNLGVWQVKQALELNWKGDLTFVKVRIQI